MSRDARHADARRIWPSLRDRPLSTTSLVVAESHAVIARRVGHGAGAAFLDRCLAHSQSVVWADEELLRAAVANWIQPCRDKNWSVTDAVSFEAMTRMDIDTAFTFDRHFEQAGFKLLR